MICYRDMTFCPFWEECRDHEECGRAFTEEVQLAAEEWWGGPHAPVSFYFSRPSCFVLKEEEVENE